MDIQELLSELGQTDEHHRIEAKTASKIGTSILETVCAYANEPGLGGGYILLGVSKEEGSTLFPVYNAVGVADPDKLSADLATQCATTFNRVIRPQVQTQVINGKVVIGVFVPEAPASEKPIYLKSKGLPGGAFRRFGSTDQKCSDDDLLVFYQGRSGAAYDATLLQGASMEDIDPDAVAEYRRSRAEIAATAEELGWADDDLLCSLGCAVKEGGALRPTAAGVLLFGKPTALRRMFPMTRVDYIRLSGREWVADPTDRFQSIDMRGPLFKLILRAQAAVLDDLPKSFKLAEGDVQRTDVPLIPARVIREAIVNSVMHRNYRVQAPVQILRYPNRLEIRNPGYSLKPEEWLGEPGSLARNPAIAAVLHETGFAETKGSGVRVMRALMQQNHLSPPHFESDRGEDKFVATFLFHHFLSPEDWTWLGRFKGMSLTNEEARALIFVREVGAINNAAYRDVNLVATLEASARLRHLRDLGLLEQRGKGSATYYVPTPLLIGAAGESGGLSPVEGRQELSVKKQMVGENEQVVGEKRQELEQERQELEQKRQEVPVDGFSPNEELPADLREALGSLGRWASPTKFRAIILRLCAWRPLRSEQLAAFTGRKREYLVRKHLSPMIETGELVYTIPQMPQHPTQAYRAAQQDQAQQIAPLDPLARPATDGPVQS